MTNFGCLQGAARCGLNRLVCSEDKSYNFLVCLYHINVNRYFYVSCSSLKPLVGAAWREMQVSRIKSIP